MSSPSTTPLTIILTSFFSGLLAGACLFQLLSLRAPPPPAAAAAADDLPRVQEQLVAERMGRVRAERSLRDAVNSRHAGGGYPVLPIGRIASPFRGRWGTPRQPMLAPHARAHVLLSPAIPADALRGLAAYSHVFVLFLFDANSSLHKMGGAVKGAKPPPPQTRAERRAGAAGAAGAGGGAPEGEPENEEEALSRALRERHFNALVEAPALKGGRTGVLSTRSPHRPNAVGLSLCRLVSVHDRAPGAAKPNSPMLVLSGCDLVSGTPVIDIKPFAPYDCPTCIGKWLQGGEAAAPGAPPPPPRRFAPARALPEALAGLRGGADFADAEPFALRGPGWVFDSLRNQAGARLPVVWGPGTVEAVTGAVAAGRTLFYGPRCAGLGRGGGGGGGGGGGREGAGGGGDASGDGSLLEDEGAALLLALTQVIALDIRAVHHGRGGAPSETRAALFGGPEALARRMGVAPAAGAAGEAAPPPPPPAAPPPGVQFFELFFDAFDVRFTVVDVEAAGRGGEGGGGARFFAEVTFVGLSESVARRV